MPSVTDLQQQSLKSSSLNNNGKSTSPHQHSNLTSSGTTTDSNNVDSITQAILILEKKQRNLGKRKEKLESYEQEAKTGKELNKDQKEALSKYGEVLGQIECIKDIYEQLKKIQTDSAKNQKRLMKQAAEEKRLLVSQRLREYAQLRYLLDHRPSVLKSEDSSLLDELARVIIPSDISLNVITRSIDTVLAIYQGGPASATIKNLTGRTSQEIREILEKLIEQSQTNDLSTPQQQTTTQNIETIKQTPLLPHVPPTTPTSAVITQREPNQPLPSLTHTHLIQTNTNDYPLQFDTRSQNIPLQQIIQDNTFFPVDLSNANNNQQDTTTTTTTTNNQSTDSKQLLQTFNNLNPNLTGQTPSQNYVQTQSAPSQQRQSQKMNTYEQENSPNVVSSSHFQTDEQQSEEQWQYPRSNSGNVNRGGHYNGSGNRNSNRGGGAQNSHNQQHWRGPRGGSHYDGGQRQYHENNNRGQRGGGGSNPNYRGGRGGNYRGGNRGGNAAYNGNGYQKSSQYQGNNEQHQVRSAPPNQQQ